MSKIKTFQELRVWQQAHNLVLSCYQLTNAFPKQEMFGQSSQIRRAAVSIAANIVEGFRRHSQKDAIRFYTFSDASLEELKYHLLLSRDLKYISTENYTEITECCNKVGALLTRWIQSQRTYLTNNKNRT